MTPWSRKEDLPAEARRLLARHVTNLESNIYCIKNLPPEVVAVLFAYVSRSPKTFRENLLSLLQSGELAAQGDPDLAAAESAELSVEELGADYEAAAEKARKFHEKWVVGYGHASVAEHADIKFAVDDVSIHAAKFLESNRLGSYTEKSSRYQVFERDSFLLPPELDRPGRMEQMLREEYLAACTTLFDAYDEAIEPLTALMEKRFPQGEGKSERAWRASLKAKVCDVARYLLPASTLTSLGISWNARAAEHAINKLLSAPCEEFHVIGERMLREGRKICPALLKHVGAKAYFRETPAELRRMVDDVMSPQQLSLLETLPSRGPRQKEADPAFLPDIRLVRDDPDAEVRLVAAILYEYGTESWEACYEQARRMTVEKQDRLIDACLNKRERFDWPMRTLEHPVFTFDMVMDYGAYRDVQRHRMATLTEQETTCRHGYDIPSEIDAAGLGDRYREAMEGARGVHERLLNSFPHLAAYVVPQGYRKRVLFTWNLREMEHFIRLRSGRQGHISYRRVAQQVHRLLAECHPRLARHIVCDYDDYGLGRLEAEERDEAKRAAVAARNTPAPGGSVS